MSNLWTHSPTLSGEPEEILDHFSHIESDLVLEVAVLRLSNDKFLFIKFTSENIIDKNCGLTDLEEFDTYEEAAKVYNQMVK